MRVTAVRVVMIV